MHRLLRFALAQLARFHPENKCSRFFSVAYANSAIAKCSCRRAKWNRRGATGGAHALEKASLRQGFRPGSARSLDGWGGYLAIGCRGKGLKIAKIALLILAALVSGELTKLHILIHGRGVLPLLLCPEPAPDTEHLFDLCTWCKN